MAECDFGIPPYELLHPSRRGQVAAPRMTMYPNLTKVAVRLIPASDRAAFYYVFFTYLSFP
jgi:hypothetical protein